MSSKNNIEVRFSEFALRINDLVCKHCGGDRYAFADRIKVAYDSVRRWCNGNNLPNGSQLITIGTEFKTSIDWLLTGREPEANFMCGWDEEVQEACRAVKEILESKNGVIVPALLSNLAAFKHAVKNDDALEDKKRIKDLEEEVKRMRKLLDQDFSGAACAEDGSRLKKKQM